MQQGSKANVEDDSLTQTIPLKLTQLSSEMIRKPAPTRYFFQQ